MNSRQLLLIVAAVGLLPLALFYGYAPEKTLGTVFNMTLNNTNGTHIFRALMGLYLGFALFWTIGALTIKLQQAALYSLMIFMFGLAAGRVLSLLLDGMPHWLLVVNLLLELTLGSIAVVMVKKEAG